MTGFSFRSPTTTARAGTCASSGARAQCRPLSQAAWLTPSWPPPGTGGGGAAAPRLPAWAASSVSRAGGGGGC
jgi:hypothetical protein